ncbi:MAG: macro domain-containing protein [Planctomycetaceae bacterium]|nr:macro domain-containing protein [Planctomycetaceae bacterium]
MPLPIDVWLIHPKFEMCEAFRRRFADLPNVTVMPSRYEDLPPHDCFVTAANSFGIMNAGIDAAVIRRHGDQLMKAVQYRILDEYLGEQPIGTSFVQPTDDSEFPFIAHTPTMRLPGSIYGTDKVYNATWAAFLAVYRHNTAADADQKIRQIVVPAMGAGFGAVPYSEVARQMAAAYDHYLRPPHRMEWAMVTRREKAIAYDSGRRVVR